jgi:hypothetical protein
VPCGINRSLPRSRNLVNDLSANAKTRAQVLRTIAEHQNLVNAEFNRAFVLMLMDAPFRRYGLSSALTSAQGQSVPALFGYILLSGTLILRLRTFTD